MMLLVVATACDKNDEPTGGEKPGGEVVTPGGDDNKEEPEDPADDPTEDPVDDPTDDPSNKPADDSNVVDYGTYKMVESKDGIQIVPKDGRPILALFVRKGCSPSQKFWPHFDTAASEDQYDWINFIKIWTDDYTSTGQDDYLAKMKASYNISGTPNMIIIAPDGKWITTIQGAQLGIKEDIDYFIGLYLKSYH